ncbi:MAG: HEAT repeat domain-containing protein, partial [Myxococcales bacterium]|nr:HEAT repeat domain-containing protein [Myxococcales bacterium]
MNNRALQVSVALLFAMVVAACGPSPESCEYWKDKLQKMDKLDKAVREVGDKKCKGVFKELEKVWDTGRIRDRVLQAVKKINDPKGAEALIIKALGDTRSGAIAAYLVRDWKIKAAEPALKKVVRNDGAEPFVKAANLKALLSFGKKEHEDFLLEVLKTNPDQQGIALNRIAAQALGEIRSVKAVPYLINALYMEQGKQNAYGEASLALVRMSKEAAPMLIKSLEGKNEILNAYAKKNRLYD